MSRNNPPFTVVSNKQRQKLKLPERSKEESKRIYDVSEKHSLHVDDLGSHLLITVFCPLCHEIFDALWYNAREPYDVKYYMGKEEFEVPTEDFFNDNKIMPLVKERQVKLNSDHHEHKNLPYED